jgi:hypothetical protein
MHQHRDWCGNTFEVELSSLNYTSKVHSSLSFKATLY